MQSNTHLSNADCLCTHYDVLGVTTTADVETIRSAYYNLARQLHPDRNASSSCEAAKDHFAIVQNAYSVLSDEHLRHEYDVTLKIRSFQNKHAESSAIQILRCDCSEVIVKQADEEREDEIVELVFTCRCGNLIETSFADEETNLIACSMCTLQYDTTPLWRAGEIDSNI